eukprot:s1012_g5.t1
MRPVGVSQDLGTAPNQKLSPANSHLRLCLVRRAHELHAPGASLRQVLQLPCISGSFDLRHRKSLAACLLFWHATGPKALLLQRVAGRQVLSPIHYVLTALQGDTPSGARSRDVLRDAVLEGSMDPGPATRHLATTLRLRRS